MVTLSVIVPVYREGAGLQVLLAAFGAQTLDADRFEVILVDNDPDGPAPLPPLPALPFAAQVVDCRIPGSYAARNAGAAHASGKIFAFTDSDCLPTMGWLCALVAASIEMQDEILVGPVDLYAAPVPNVWEIFDTVRGMRQDIFVRHGYGVTANLAVRATLFRHLGGFDDARLSGGDAEFCRRAGRQGVRLRLVTSAKVRHPARKSREEIETKARRIKGGQISIGPIWQRALWGVRSLCPPAREMGMYLLEKEFPLRWRFIACHIRMLLWRVELHELYRLSVLRKPPERR